MNTIRGDVKIRNTSTTTGGGGGGVITKFIVISENVSPTVLSIARWIKSLFFVTDVR